MRYLMNLLKLIFICSVFLILAACSNNKDPGASAFQNYTAKQLLVEGEAQLAKNNFQDAIKRFEALDALYPFNEEAKQGEIDIIYAYYKADDYPSTIAAADRYIHLYPDGAHTDYAYYMKGIAHFESDRNWLQRLYSENPEQLDLTSLQQAFINFNDLIKLFPNSIYVKDAQARMYYIRNLMAERELQVAQFYFRHKAYVAAANRASEIVKHYEGTPQVPAALKIMVDSYQALGATKQANDALKVLQTNYPKSL